LGWDVNGAFLAMGTVARKGSFEGGEGTRAEAGVGEDLKEIDSGGFL
jgi:hypothetical protein